VGANPEEIRRAGFERQVLSSVVLVGGGSMLDGIVDMAEQVLDLPARSGGPDFIGGLSGDVASPANAAVVGVMLYGYHKQMNLKKIHSLKDGAPKQPGLFRRIFG
jgi:cell division protein FtsA